MRLAVSESDLKVSPRTQPPSVRDVPLTDEMRKTLEAIKDAYAKEHNITVWIEAYSEASVAYGKRIRLAEQRNRAIVALLTKEYGVPEASIKTGMSKKAAKEPIVKAMVRTPQNKP